MFLCCQYTDDLPFTGKRSYKLVSAKKGKKSFRKKFKINAKTGNVTLKKGLKKGTYKVKVKVKAKGTTNYKPSVWKTVTFKVRERAGAK